MTDGGARGEGGRRSKFVLTQVDGIQADTEKLRGELQKKHKEENEVLAKAAQKAEVEDKVFEMLRRDRDRPCKNT